jgi:hypothetical protein
LCTDCGKVIISQELHEILVEGVGLLGRSGYVSGFLAQRDKGVAVVSSMGLVDDVRLVWAIPKFRVVFDGGGFWSCGRR